MSSLVAQSLAVCLNNLETETCQEVLALVDLEKLEMIRQAIKAKRREEQIFVVLRKGLKRSDLPGKFPQVIHDFLGRYGYETIKHTERTDPALVLTCRLLAPDDPTITIVRSKLIKNCFIHDYCGDEYYAINRSEKRERITWHDPSIRARPESFFADISDFAKSRKITLALEQDFPQSGPYRLYD